MHFVHKRSLVTSAKIKIIHIAPPGAIKFPVVCCGRKRGTDDGLFGEVSSLLEEICSSLEEICLSLRQFLLLLGGFILFLRMILLQHTIVVPRTTVDQWQRPVYGQTTIRIYILAAPPNFIPLRKTVILIMYFSFYSLTNFF